MHLNQIGQPNNQSARETIVAVQKNGDGDLQAFKTSSGRVLNYAEALQEVQAADLGAFMGLDVAAP